MQTDMRCIDAHQTQALVLSEAVFGAPFNESLIHQAVVATLAKQRQGSKAQKSRSEVRGGGAKPWRQKGTGRARVGTIRSPLWRGGGKVFAAKPRDFAQKINKKMYKSAMRSILSELMRQNRLQVVDAILLSTPKTKEMVTLLKTLSLTNALIVTEAVGKELYLASRNIPKILVCDTEELDPVLLIRFETVVMTEKAIKRLEEKWA